MWKDNVHGSVALVIWIVWTPFFIVTFLLSVLRRERYPLKQREPILLATSALGGYIILTSFAWEEFIGYASYPCVISHWLIWLIYPCYFIPYPLRALRLLFIFKLNWERRDIGVITGKKQQTNQTRSFLFTKRKLLLNHFGRIILVVQLVLFIIGIIRQFTVTSNLPPHNGCANSLQFYITSLVLFIIFQLGLAFSIFLLKDVKDQFNIRNELKVVCGAWALLLFPYLVVNMVTTIQDKPPQPLVYLVLAWTIISYLASNVWALYRTFYEPKAVEWPDHDLVHSLPKLIQNELDFAVSEFSVENLLCYLDIQEFKKITILDLAKERAVEIYNKYLKFEAPLFLNVDGNLVVPIENQIEKIEEELKGRVRLSTPVQEKRSSFKRGSLRESQSTSLDNLESYTEKFRAECKELDLLKTLFDQVELACWDLMRNSSYPRFLRSEYCKKLVEILDKETATKETIEDLRLSVDKFDLKF